MSYVFTPAQAALSGLPPRVQFWITQSWVQSATPRDCVALVFEQTTYLLDLKLATFALALLDFNSEATAEQLEVMNG